MKRLLLSLITLISCLFLPACSKPLPISEAIVGQWDDPKEPGENFRFFADNTMIVTINGQQVSGEWAMAGEDSVKTTPTVLGVGIGTSIFENIHISGGSMTYSLNGQKFTLRRKK